MLAVFAVIFQQNLPYFNFFLDSLRSQSDKSFKLFLVNDGVDSISDYLHSCDFEIEILNVRGIQPFQIRIVGLSELLKRNSSIVKYVLFADTDDGLGYNRVEVSKKYLKQYPFVCNDLSLMDADGSVFKDVLWGKRVVDDFEFDNSFLVDKNIIGFGNSGMHISMLESVLAKLQNVILGNDWLFYACFEKYFIATFIKECKTLYRQHNNNTIGNKELSVERLLAIIQAKLNHYSTLKKLEISSFDVNRYIEENKLLIDYFNKNPLEIQTQLVAINSLGLNFFWWEETNYLKIIK